MQKHREMTLRRLKTFQQEIRSHLYSDPQPVDLIHHAASGRIRYDEAVKQTYGAVELGQKLYPTWSTHWFRVNFNIPEAWQDKEIHFRWDSSSEACVWYQGEPLQGLTGSTSGWQEEPIRDAFPLNPSLVKNGQVEFYIEAALNGLFGAPWHKPKELERIGWLRKAEMALFDRAVWDLLWDFVIIAEMAEALPQDTPRAGQALFAANAMVNTVDWHDGESLTKAREIAAKFLAQTNGKAQHQLSAIGHAHIDTAWLWPLAETKRKCVRTFSTALDLMDKFPDYKFVCSQAQQLAWMKAEYPGLYARIKEKAKAGQFIPAGATWVEPDTNVPSGEALVRQFLYGQRFFKEEFGAYSKVFWEPDVFGYSGALPQIMQGAGVEYFLTQKLSWNEFNKPDRHTFYWEGLDGSRVLAHFPPVDTYNSLANVRDVLYNVANYKDHERSNESYLLFGYGDGGGGPTTAMLEQVTRMADVDGLPNVQMRAPEDFFERLEADLQHGTIQRGELYFENHRGTYTTQAKTKKYNRLSEQKLHDLEFLSVVNWLNEKGNYPQDEMLSIWQKVLTNQFHDILPGSSIQIVYEEAEATYTQIETELDELIAKQTSQLTAGEEDLSLINTIGVNRREVVDLPDNKGLAPVSLPPYSVMRFDEAQVEESRSVKVSETERGYQLENDFVRVKLCRNGEVESFYVKTQEREIIEYGEYGNKLVLYDDHPTAFDAWNVDVFYLEKYALVKTKAHSEIEESDPLRVTICFERALGQKSKLVQRISLSAVSPRLDFDCWVDWQEDQQFLRVLFPLDLRSDQATYEVQFGCVQRPTHFNTSYDLARFEVPAQRWGDLSEPDFGVALINDCKYGYACHENVLSLSLLRATTNPDPQADRGEHRFRYALYPHALTPQLSAVWSEASAFNQPLLRVPGGSLLSNGSLFRVDAPNIVLDTVKRAEDGDGVVLRLYEASGCQTTAKISFQFAFKSAHQVDLLEQPGFEMPIQGQSITYRFKAFEILTILLK